MSNRAKITKHANEMVRIALECDGDPDENISFTGEESRFRGAIHAMEEKIEILSNALQIYADERSYVTDIKGIKIEATVMQDQGEVARKALNETK